MKLCLLSDIHSNLYALEACLEHAHNEGVTHYAFLGDLVGYGAFPHEVLEIIMKMVNDEQAWAVRGNHDQLVTELKSDKVHTNASLTQNWTYEQLSEGERMFLSTLPLTTKVKNILLVHSSASQPHLWRYIDNEINARECLQAAKTQFETGQIFVGHVHHQGLYYQGAGRGLMHFVPTPGVAIPIISHRDFIVTVGSVGQPRDGDVRAMYTIYDQDSLKITFHRVEYDHQKAADAVREKGLPESQALRLEQGR